jgi:hypothetical protein
MRALMRALILALVLLTATQAASAATDSGVSGQVRIDRPCGIRAGGCGSRRVTATVVVRERSTHRRVRTLRARHGRFRASLEPGRYTLTARSDQAPRPASRSVRVTSGRFAAVVLHLPAPERIPR